MSATKAPSSLSRRNFFGCAACAAVAGSGFFASPVFAQAAGGPAVAPGALRRPFPAARTATREMPYGSVHLTGGLMKAHFDRIHAHYLALDNDRLLKVYRENVGLDAPGRDMGGWYDHDDFIAGHTLGQYISGLSRLGAASGDPACHQKARDLVAGLATVLERNPNPYPGPGSQNVWAAYVMDKYVIGLIDAYRLSGVEQAKDLLPRVVDACLPFISPVSRDRIGKREPPYDETYVLPENLFAVAEITGDPKYRELAERYLLDPEWFDPLSRGEDVLPHKHAYSHTIALSSGGQAYLSLGDPKYKAALENAWTFMEPQRFASGGWGPEEQFVEHGQGLLYASLQTSKAHFETPCGAYADTKLARYLMRFTGDGRYGDGLERIMYNAILATRLPDSDGGYPYYSSYGAEAEKLYYHRKWPCCSGTLVQTVADYVLDVYFEDDEGIYVNLYTPSTVNWTHAGREVRLVQETDYPASDTAKIRVEAASPTRFKMRVRIPGWLQQAAQVKVNGETVSVQAQNGFATLDRTWRSGDTVELLLPQTLHTKAIDPEHPNVVALLRGPVMYVGLNPWPELSDTVAPLPGGLKPVADNQEVYAMRVGGKDLIFTPYFNVTDERYNTYFRQA